jgi:predicted dithiol-disulfide oxidoreductase (DUF899 family)
MTDSKHAVVPLEEWKTVRASLLEKEKAHTKQRDILTSQIRSLPWTKLPQSYTFQTPSGPSSLIDLFDGKSQLFIYHFMFSPGSKEGCPNCSFWADNFQGLPHHLPQRDVSFKVISRAPLDEFLPFKQRMGWEFDWVSSAGSEFNKDMGVLTETGEDWFGVSILYFDGRDVFLTYNTKGRGIEVFNPTYSVLDLVPGGRDEGGLSYPMAWIKLHDQY